MIQADFFEELTPAEIKMIKEHLMSDMIPGIEGAVNAENLNNAVTKCPHCRSEKIIKYGFNGKTQRFKCHKCSKTFSSTTGTMFFSSNTDYETWSAFIDSEIKGLSLSEESYTIHNPGQLVLT